MASSPFDANTFDVTTWLLKDRLVKKMDPSQGGSLENPSIEEILFGSTPAPSTTPDSRFEVFESFLHALVLEQLKRPEDLLKLNPSRRESLGRFLSELSKLPEPELPQEALKQFVRMDRTESEHEALKQLFKQIAIVQIAKALLVKSWRKHANIPMNRADLKDLTAAIEKELRSFIHLQTSSCQLIQRNFYSWYKMSSETQEQLWELLSAVENLEAAKDWLLKRARNLSAETLGERSRYSDSFYKNLWQSIEKHRLFQARSDQLIGFSPTLRDGCLFESAPSNIEWIGFEPLSFELLFCEIRYLWKEPKNPPLWIKGNGLEMSMEQQSSLLLTNSGKQNILKQMDNVSCADVALIAEESLIRTQGRSLAAQALRKIVDHHSILKKLKQPATTRGMYQACQALDKLRQGGVLIWAREELLTEASGKPTLQFILNQAKILFIADLSALMCESDRLQQDIPKVLYILKKENQLENRKSHRPLLIKAFGTLSQEKEVTALFDRIMSLVQKPDQILPPEPFHLHARVSPMDQREWEQHWFNPNDDQLVDQIENLKRNSSPLGQFVAVRTFHPNLNSTPSSMDASLFSETQLSPENGFYVWVESSKNGNELFTAPMEKLPSYVKTLNSLFWVSPLRKEWSIPLQALFRSQLARDWFEYSIERKKGAWILKESDLKSIPVPRHLSDELLAETKDLAALDPRAAKILSLISSEPHSALSAIENHPELKAQAFIFASQILAQLEEHQGALFKLVAPDEQLIYKKLFESVLTDKDLSGLNQHPLIRFTPMLSSHQTIQSATALKVPTPGILLTTPKGLTQILYIQDAWLRDRCLEAIEELQKEIAEPTWGELSKLIRLPKNPDQAQAMGNQILRAFSTEKMRRKELNHLISVCLLSQKENAEKIGLLQ